jgi:uncharacterized protein
MVEAIICDTSVWLYLGRIEQTELLAKLYKRVYTTETVCYELDNGRLTRPETIDPRQYGWVHLVQPLAADITQLPANRLGQGEQSVLAYAQTHHLHIVGLDDREARQVATQMGLQVIGTIGILLKAKEGGLVAEIRPLLEQLQAAGFYIHKAVWSYALQKTNETS